MRSIPLWIVVLAVPACGGTSTGATEDASTFDIGAQADATPTSVCPAALPVAGTACTMPQSPGPPWPCEYGADPRCTTVAQCIGKVSGPSTVSGTWQVYSPEEPLCKGNPPDCPAAFDPDAGANGPIPCPTQNSCWYPQGSCACASCAGPGGNCGTRNLCGGDAGPSRGADGGVTGGSTWLCEPWPVPGGCPEPRPRLGTPCHADPNLMCGYGPLCCGQVPNPQPVMQCIGGFWDTCACGC